MSRSIRWRLQFWYAVVLAGVVAGFGSFLYFSVRDARLREIDADLFAAANYLDVQLRPWPRFDLDGEPPPKKPPPKPKPPPPREVRLRELTPPGWQDKSDCSYGVWRRDGSPIKVVGRDRGLPQFGLDPRGEVVMFDAADGREAVRRGPRGTWIVVARSTEALRAEMRAFAGQLALTGLGVLLVGLAGGWWVSSRIVGPIAAITATASRISATNLSERIEARGVERELEQLANVLNATFGRLESAFAQLTRFTADASHELRTPLAVLRSQAELALSRPRAPEEYRETVEACLKAALRMTNLVEGLLTLARADAGRLELRTAPVDLVAVVQEALAQARPLAEDRQVALAATVSPAVVKGDAAMLARVVGNLLENAIRYNRPGGRVNVELVEADGEAVLRVQDDGVGIPAEDQPRVFERFFRVDKARSRAMGGSGLGLAICKAIVEAHGGSVTFESRLGESTTFRVRLPR